MWFFVTEMKTEELKDISTREDVELLVDRFYAKIRVHSELGPIFNDRIRDHWDEHMVTLVNFWETLLLNNRTYFGAPFPKHVNLPIEDLHFEMWLSLFFMTIDEHFQGPVAEDAKFRAHNIARSFSFKIAYFRSGGQG